jgi:hypothetical protein
MIDKTLVAKSIFAKYCEECIAMTEEDEEEVI